MTDQFLPDSAKDISSLPPWHHYMRPVLDVLVDGEARQSREFRVAVLDHAGATPAQRAEQLGNGKSRALNRVGWAISALSRAKAIDKPARGVYLITDTGRQLLAKHPERIAEKDLESIPAYIEYVPVRGERVPSTSETLPTLADDEDPTELIESGIAKFESDVASDLIRRLRDQHPDFFEQAVVDLLIAMGYGGAEQRVRKLGQTNDGGVDGVIDQDALGLNRVYVQAKRYGAGNSVGRPEVQGFVGALADKGAMQGVFVTTSTFSSGALEYVDRIPNRVVMIDGTRLAELMIRYRVAVQVKRTYSVVEVDEDYFE